MTVLLIALASIGALGLGACLTRAGLHMLGREIDKAVRKLCP